MAEVVLERRAALRSNGEKIREVVRLKELQHHFISYRSKVFWTRGIAFCVVYFGKRNHFHFLSGVLDKRNHFHFLGGVLDKRNQFQCLRGAFWEEKLLSLSGWCFGQ